MTYLLIIFSLAFVLIIIEIIGKIIRNFKCLENDTIANFMSNQLSEEERDRFIAHIGGCKKCQQRLHEYNFGKKIENHLIAPEQKE